VKIQIPAGLDLSTGDAVKAREPRGSYLGAMNEPVGFAPHPARWWRPLENGRVLCELCPRLCRPAPGQRAYCLIRRNEGGVLVTDGRNAGIGFAADPIEKKPLYHVHPGSRVLSFGTAGCNLGCVHCQNWTLSQAREALGRMERATPALIVRTARNQGCAGVAFTYNEPLIFGEFLLECAAAAREAGLFTVMVSNGYALPAPAREIFGAVDAANIDLKGFHEERHRRLTRGRLAPVLDTLRMIRRETATWLELTTLLIPGHNDSDTELGELARWVVGELGADTPIHFTAFHPDHHLREVLATPAATLLRARDIAREAGLHFVYLGNLPLAEGRDTFCPGCGTRCVERATAGAAQPQSQPALRAGACSACGRILPGQW
jgi:pyruvate formate lyase activating enzyme